MTATPTLTPWQATLDGLLMGPGTPYDFVEPFPNLGELPGVSDEDEAIADGDGEYSGADYVQGRTITMELEVAADDSTSLADALAALELASRPKRDVDLWALLPTWSTPRRTTVRIRRRAMPVDGVLESGLAYVTVQLRAADPVLYGPDTTTLVTGFPVAAGGLQYPLYTDGAGLDVGHLDYGASSTTGRLLLTNTGTADVAPWFEIVGPVPAEGFAIVRTDDGRRIQFEGPVAAGATLVVDAVDGSAIIDGSADRGGQLTWRQFWTVGARQSVEVAFLPLGATSAAQLTAHAPSGWW